MALPPVSTGDPHVSAHNTERTLINSLESQLPRLIAKPTTPLVGEMLRYDGSNWVSSKTRLFEGLGQPEGVVAAPIGSRYIQTDGANGAVEWLKVTGLNANDNTGWSLLFGDTKYRNISSSIVKPAGSIVYGAYIRRNNNLIDAYFDMQTPNATGSWNFFTLPVGFRPPFTRYGVMSDTNETAASYLLVNNNGQCTLPVIRANTRDHWNGQWMTDDPWPVALPGAALG